MNKLKIMRKAPLPFVGQKRNFIRHFVQLLKQHIADQGEGWTIVDVFGGSGLLSHVAKQLKPQARVIYNDFDNYRQRLAHIDDTNRLRQQIAQLVDAKANKQKLSPEQKAQILQIVEQFDGYKDFKTIAGWLLFSGRVANDFDSLKKGDFYNRVPRVDYQAEGYLQGVEVVTQSFEQLIPEFASKPNVLLLLDPPYLMTEYRGYEMNGYFDLISFLTLIKQITPPFMLFSSTKSEILSVIEWIKRHGDLNQVAFQQAQVLQINTNLNQSKFYQDNLIYNFTQTGA